MESGLLRTPMTNNDMVLGSGQFSKCSSSAPSAHLLCSLILWLGGIGRLGGLRGTGATHRGLDEDRGLAPGASLANRSGPQSGSFDHGSMVTWNLYLYVDDYYQCEIYLRNGTNVLPCSRLRPTITCFSRKRQNSNSFAFNATGLENSDRYLITPKK